MFKPRKLRFIIMLNPIIIRLTRGFRPCHYHLPGAVDGMAVITAVGTAAAGTTELINRVHLGHKKGTLNKSECL